MLPAHHEEGVEGAGWPQTACAPEGLSGGHHQPVCVHAQVMEDSLGGGTGSDQ